MTQGMKVFQITAMIVMFTFCGICSYFKMMWLIPVTCIAVGGICVLRLYLKGDLRRKNEPRSSSPYHRT